MRFDVNLVFTATSEGDAAKKKGILSGKKSKKMERRDGVLGPPNYGGRKLK